MYIITINHTVCPTIAPNVVVYSSSMVPPTLFDQPPLFDQTGQEWLPLQRTTLPIERPRAGCCPSLEIHLEDTATDMCVRHVCYREIIAVVVAVVVAVAAGMERLEVWVAQ